MLRAIVKLVLVSPVASSGGCERRVDALEAEVDSLKGEIASLTKIVKGLLPQTNANEQAAASSAQISSRRLTDSGKTFLAVETKHVHEFPADHGCSNFGDYHNLMPELASNGDPQFQTGSPNVGPNLSLASVGSQWTTNVIQSMPSPFIVKHTQGCNTPPTLEVRPDTNFVGSVTVNGIPVGAPTAISWKDIQYDNGAVEAYSGFPLQCAVQNGFLVVRGSVERRSSVEWENGFHPGESFGTLPAECPPPSRTHYGVGPAIKSGGFHRFSVQMDGKLFAYPIDGAEIGGSYQTFQKVTDFFIDGFMVPLP